MYLVYILKSGNHSYIGMTNDFFKRWKQHNKIIKGGAKYTSKYHNWSPICIIDGFKNKSEAMQCEWKLKRVKVIIIVFVIYQIFYKIIKHGQKTAH